MGKMVTETKLSNEGYVATRKNFVKYRIKDSVFTTLFGDKMYVFQLYNQLHPEDSDATPDDITIVTICNTLINVEYNDLAFLVRDELLILVEAQSTWTYNILPRLGGYAYGIIDREIANRGAESEEYGKTRMWMPIIENYVIYVGAPDKSIKNEEISMSKDFFNNKNATMVDIKASVICDAPRETIVGQYIAFCRIVTEQITAHGRTKRAIEETIKICKGNNILREFLTTKEREVSTIMDEIFNYSGLFEKVLEDAEKEAREKGLEEGKAKQLRENIIALNGVVAPELMAEKFKLPLQQVLDILAEADNPKP